jgi:hypothetical protein
VILRDVPWSDLKIGQGVSVTSTTDVMLGTIVRLEREPMIWIAWKDGNHQEYHQSVLPHVELLDEVEHAGSHDFDKILTDREFIDAEGE